VLEVYCQMLYDLNQALLIFTATPGSDSHDKLQLLSVIGAQKLRSRSWPAKTSDCHVHRRGSRRESPEGRREAGPS